MRESGRGGQEHALCVPIRTRAKGGWRDELRVTVRVTGERASAVAVAVRVLYTRARAGPQRVKRGCERVDGWGRGEASLRVARG